jgi:hypothetical protein
MSQRSRNIKSHKVKPDFKKILGKKRELEEQIQEEKPVEAASQLDFKKKEANDNDKVDEESDFDSDEDDYVDYVDEVGNIFAQYYNIDRMKRTYKLISTLAYQISIRTTLVSNYTPKII